MSPEELEKIEEALRYSLMHSTDCEDADYFQKFTPKLLVALKEKDSRIQRLENALNISRGQWIHSVNAQQCLEALSADEESK